MLHEICEFHGHPAVRLTGRDHASCVVSLHGAQVLSWVTPDGHERLYLSPKAIFDGRSAVRGGVPVCWPQFNERGSLPKHGFARNLPWTLAAAPSADPSELALELTDDAATRSMWPHAFRLRLQVTLAPGTLQIKLRVQNTGQVAWSFTAALHTYLRVDDIAGVRLEGLAGAQRWDALQGDRQAEVALPLRFDGEFDRVYAAPAEPLRLVQQTGTVQIAQSTTCSETVVWNPGAALAKRLADMPDDGYRHMLCVEAARIDQAVALEAGTSWEAWQSLNIA